MVVISSEKDVRTRLLKSKNVVDSDMGIFLFTRCCQCVTGISKNSKDTFFGSSAPVPEKVKSQTLNQEIRNRRRNKNEKIIKIIKSQHESDKTVNSTN